jgi:hypothetical protein
MSGGHWIQTLSGRRVDVFDPDPGDFAAEDIAAGLANTCRFSGQLQHHYSVAQHSLIMSYTVPGFCAFEALLHDAAEAYLGDVPRPIKYGLPDYRAVSEIVETAIALRWRLVYPWPDEVHAADMRMVMTEARHFGRDTAEWGIDAVPYDIELIRTTPEVSRVAWMARFRQLERERMGQHGGNQNAR